MVRNSHAAFTILEALVTAAIVTLLAALLYPTFADLKRRAYIASSMQRMRQFHLAIEIYRNEYDGTDRFDSYASYYTLGLPTETNVGFVALPGVPLGLWESPCSSKPADPTICYTAHLPGYCGYISYVAGLYDPRLIEQEPYVGNGNRLYYMDYIVRYKQNIVLMVDPYCNPAGTHMMSHLTSKRGIALLLSGQAVNKIAPGDASKLQWYSDEAEY